jgi:HlyD family secretion protein
MNKKRRIVIVAVIVAAVAAATWIIFGRGEDTNLILASGTVEATEADLGFQVSGRVSRIAVEEGSRVAKGQELAWLDRTELSARRSAASAQVDAARAVLAEMQSGFREEEVAQGRAALRAAEQRLSNTRREYERTQRLLQGGAVSQRVFDNQETALELAQSDYETAQEQLRVLESGPRAERIAAQRAALAQAEAGLAQADATLDYALIRAPFDGAISVRHREPGETVPAGSPVLAVRSLDDRWVRIYVREDELGRISIGQDAVITADSYPDRTYSGRIVFLSSEAEFTPRNVQTTEERVKLVYRVKVQITGDESHDLKPGLAADVRIDTNSP